MTTTSGEVILNGSVNNLLAKERAARVARTVKGVRRVINTISVVPPPQNDRVIQESVQTALMMDPATEHYQIEVSVDRGRVTLDAEQLKVLPGGGISAQNRTLPFADPEVRRAVARKLTDHPRLETLEIEISVEEGTVTLNGQVDHLKAKQTAEWLARNTSGVWRVKNHLRVRPDDMPSDPSIALNVRAALKRNPVLGNDQIKVSVDNGKVTLFGTVDSLFEMEEAADAASRVNGVIALNNNLRAPATAISSFDPYVDTTSKSREYADTLPPVASQQDDWEIAMDIRNELWWSPFVDRDQVDVQVHNGVAVLRGTVDSLQERSAAEQNALQAGAARVKNRLKIRQGPQERRP